MSYIIYTRTYLRNVYIHLIPKAAQRLWPHFFFARLPFPRNPFQNNSQLFISADFSDSPTKPLEMVSDVCLCKAISYVLLLKIYSTGNSGEYCSKPTSTPPPMIYGRFTTQFPPMAPLAGAFSSSCRGSVTPKSSILATTWSCYPTAMPGRKTNWAKGFCSGWF